jgi:hypothetical protein
MLEFAFPYILEWTTEMVASGPQGAWRQDELIGGKPPVVK